MNAAIGQSAILLGFLASVLGAGTLVTGLVKRRDTLLRAGRTYAWLLLIAALLFAIFLGRFAHLSGEGRPYFLFALAGLVPWTFFATALNSSADTCVIVPTSSRSASGDTQ